MTSLASKVMLFLMFYPPMRMFTVGSPIDHQNLLLHDQWHIFADDERPSVYWLFDDEPRDFFDAERNCRKYGAHLASFSTLVEFNFIKKVAAARGVKNVSDYWLGIYNVGECPEEDYCTYYFTDGTVFDANRWASAIAPRFFQVEENGSTTPVFQDADYRGGGASTHIRPHYCHSFRDDYVESAQCATRRRAHVCMATQVSTATIEPPPPGVTVTMTDETTTPTKAETPAMTASTTRRPITATSIGAERMTAEWRLADGLSVFRELYANSADMPTLEPGMILDDGSGVRRFVPLSKVNALCVEEPFVSGQLVTDLFYADERLVFAAQVCRRARYDHCILERNVSATDAAWLDAADVWWWRNVHCVWVADAARLLPLSALVLAAVAVVLTLALTACCVARRVRREKATGDYGVREKHEETLGAEFLDDDCEAGAAFRSPSVRRQSSRRLFQQQKERMYHPQLPSSSLSTASSPSAAGASPPQFRPSGTADEPTCPASNGNEGSYLAAESHHLFILDATSHYEEPSRMLQRPMVPEGADCCQQLHYQEEAVALENGDEENGSQRNSPPYLVLAPTRRISTLC